MIPIAKGFVAHNFCVQNAFFEKENFTGKWTSSVTFPSLKRAALAELSELVHVELKVFSIKIKFYVSINFFLPVIEM